MSTNQEPSKILTIYWGLMQGWHLMWENETILENSMTLRKYVSFLGYHNRTAMTIYLIDMFMQHPKKIDCDANPFEQHSSLRDRVSQAIFRIKKELGKNTLPIFNTRNSYVIKCNHVKIIGFDKIWIPKKDNFPVGRNVEIV